MIRDIDGVGGPKRCWAATRAAGGLGAERVDLLSAKGIASIRVGGVKGVEPNETHLVLVRGSGGQGKKDQPWR